MVHKGIMQRHRVHGDGYEHRKTDPPAELRDRGEKLEETRHGRLGAHPTQRVLYLLPSKDHEHGPCDQAKQKKSDRCKGR